MTSRLPGATPPLLAATVLLLSGCAQTLASISPSDIMNAAVIIGGAIDSRPRSGGGSGGSGSGSSTSSGSARVRIPRSPAPSAAATRVLETADQYVGVRYTWGGNTPKSGFDCSGFTKFVFAKEGIVLPRTSREQVRAGSPVPLDFGAMIPGDIILFAEPGEAISHVAIYVGDGRIIHASSAMGGVNYLDLAGDRSAWYVQNMVAVRRLIAGGRSFAQATER